MRAPALVLGMAICCSGWAVLGGANRPSQAGQSAQGNALETQAVEIPDLDVYKHRVGPRTAIRMTPERPQDIFQGVKLTLIVDTEGNVISAVPEEGPAKAFAQAAAEAKGWMYVPFEKDGVAVVARITDYARVLPPEDLPKVHQEFPSVKNAAGMVMTLHRTGCYGSCPAYEVEIHGDGTVLYKGTAFVVVAGEHQDHISSEQVEEIVEAFRKADYFSLKDQYRYMVTDNPTYVTSFRVDQIKKTVTDYVGDEAGMPQAVTDLEETIDRIAGTVKWVRGNEDTVPSLKKEGWDFKSPEAAQVMARAAEDGSSRLVSDLLAAGAGAAVAHQSGSSALSGAASAGDRKTLEMLIKAGVGKGNEPMKTDALAAAAAQGNIDMVRSLLAYGGDPTGEIKDEQVVRTVLMSAAMSGVPEVVQTILAGGADVNARDEKGHTALWSVFDASEYYDKERHADRGRVIHLLARAGANLNAQDDQGNTALHGCYDEDVAKALIEDGADVNVRNKKGETPLMSNFSVEVAKLLVAAGADIHAKDDEGHTALDHAKDLEINGEREKFLRSLETAKARRRETSR